MSQPEKMPVLKIEESWNTFRAVGQHPTPDGEGTNLTISDASHLIMVRFLFEMASFTELWDILARAIHKQEEAACPDQVSAPGPPSHSSQI